MADKPLVTGFVQDEETQPRCWLYHKEYAPEGRIFEKPTSALLDMADQGWVDSPAKIGVNVWNINPSMVADPALDEAVEVQKRAYESGKVPGIEIGASVNIEAQKEAEALQARKDALERDIRAAEDKLRESKDKTEVELERARQIKKQKGDDRPARKIIGGTPLAKQAAEEEEPAPEIEEDTGADSAEEEADSGDDVPLNF